MKTRNWALALGLTVFCSSVSAGPKPADAIKYRQSAMMYMRWNVSVIKAQLGGDPAALAPQRIKAAADAIAAVTASGLLELFAPGTEMGRGWKETLVKPALFEDPAQAEEKLQAVNQAAQALAAAADSGDPAAMQTRFDAMFQACRSCHKPFRSKPQ